MHRPRAWDLVVVRVQRARGSGAGVLGRGRGGGAPSWTTRPCRSTTARSSSGARAPSSCSTTTTVVSRRRASRRAPRRRSAGSGEVDAGDGLVEDEQVRPRARAPGRSARAAAGRRTAAGRRGRPVAEAHGVQRGRDAPCARVPGRAAGGRAAVPDTTTSQRGRRDAACGADPLGHVAHPVPRDAAAQRRAEEPHASPRRRGDDADERRAPGSTCPTRSRRAARPPHRRPEVDVVRIRRRRATHAPRAQHGPDGLVLATFHARRCVRGAALMSTPARRAARRGSARMTAR